VESDSVGFLTPAETHPTRRMLTCLLSIACFKKYDQAFGIPEKLFTDRSSFLLLAFGDPLSESIQTHEMYSDYHSRIYQLPYHAQKSEKGTAPDAAAAQMYMDRL